MTAHDAKTVSLLEAIKAALNTEEDGEALVEVARNACRAEQELAALLLTEAAQ